MVKYQILTWIISLPGRQVMLEQPKKSGGKLVSHILASHGGNQGFSSIQGLSSFQLKGCTALEANIFFILVPKEARHCALSLSDCILGSTKLSKMHPPFKHNQMSPEPFLHLEYHLWWELQREKVVKCWQAVYDGRQNWGGIKWHFLKLIWVSMHSSKLTISFYWCK